MNAISTSPIRTFAALCSVAVLGLSTTGCMGGTGMSPAMTQQASAMHHFAMAVHMGELEEAQLALSRTQNAQVRAFAQQMVNDHTIGMHMEEQMAMSMHMDDMGNGSSMSGRASMVGTGTTTTGGGDPLAANGGATRQTGSSSSSAGNGSAMAGGMPMPMDPEHMQRMRAELASNPASRPVVEDHMRGMQMLQGLSGAQFDQAYMTRQVGLHRYALEQMDRMMSEVNMGMGTSGGTMDHGAMTSGGAAGGGSAMNAGAITMGTREGMMTMHMQERQMVAMHLQQAQQIVSSMR
ncbi:DUF4142 domain-containing protein [Longimicrobium terrae]|uniref:Putative outer membrane protein n=1 Tax=Longimicrobium terrae TaxID=1639882 RepID=A0A841H2Y9_9BACT|nr:DUF4142 domain-containing protein [Longimicrobium terrae]MBB4637780.1 putative outer membrane protein [Longimicrobium terrae]MBB6072364.1 putative outer membrane protein [Longimicrobium terrae]NNC31282.1 DUF4142 domain-containing protein [Longimicrobium terrae]